MHAPCQLFGHTNSNGRRALHTQHINFTCSSPRPKEHPMTAPGNGHLPPHTPHSQIEDLSLLQQQVRQFMRLKCKSAFPALASYCTGSSVEAYYWNQADLAVTGVMRLTNVMDCKETVRSLVRTWKSMPSLFPLL